MCTTPKVRNLAHIQLDDDKYQAGGYAVLQFGGVLGLGSDYYPVPWMAGVRRRGRGLRYRRDKNSRKCAPLLGWKRPEFTSAYGSEVDSAYGIEYARRDE